MLLEIFVQFILFMFVVPITIAVLVGYIFGEIPSWPMAKAEWEEHGETLTAWKYWKYYLS